MRLFFKLVRLGGRFERRTNKLVMAVSLNLLIFALNFILYANGKLLGHGHNYFLRSNDIFLKLETTQNYFKENVGLENIVLPFCGFVVNKFISFLGYNYTELVFYFLSIFPYVLFIILFCYVFRESLGLIGTSALCVALYSSGITPYMLSWGGYVDGVNYLLLLLVFLSINRSFGLTILLIMLGTLNHYLFTACVLIMVLSMYIMRPKVSYLWIMLVCLATVLITQTGLFYLYGELSFARIYRNLSHWRSPIKQILEAYGPFPWNIFSSFKLNILPIIYLSIFLFKKNKILCAGYIIPMVSGIVMIFFFVDVTRIITHFFMISFFFLIIVLINDNSNCTVKSLVKIDDKSKRLLYRMFIVCSVLNIFVPNYYVNNGYVIIPDSIMIHKVLYLGFGKLSDFL